MLRFIIIVIFVVSFLILSTPVMFTLWLIGKKRPDIKDNASRKIIQWAFGAVRFIAGTNLIIKGRENIPTDHAVLYVCNHRSYFDIVLNYIAVPGNTGFIAKKEMNKYPLLRVWMRYIHCLFLDRDDIRQGMQTILSGVGKVKSGISIFIFPEGTRNKSEDEFLPFKAGSLKIAEKSGCPIIPVAINNSDGVFEKQFPKIYKTTVVIEFSTPIYPNDLDKEEKKKLSDNIVNTITTMYEQNKALLTH